MYLLNEDTICAPATVPGTGAVSVIRVSGPEALNVVSGLVKCAPGREIASAPGYSARFGRIFSEDGGLLDEVIVTVFRAPHSYTGEDSAEITCHASRYIVDSIMLLLMEAGVRSAAPGEFTRRAFLNGKMDLVQAEAVADLIASENANAHRVALSQMKGNFSSELKKMRAELLNIVSLMELELDFSEEEVEFADRSELAALVDGVTAHIDGLVSSFRVGNAIKNGIPVAIAGATNTGKSTLLNALLGEERAIVSDIHGTTRDTVEETMNVDGLQFRFIDTAGIREAEDVVERIGIERTFKKMQEAQVILGVVDVSRQRKEVVAEFRNLAGRYEPGTQKFLLVLNKADLLADGEIEALLDELGIGEGLVRNVSDSDAGNGVASGLGGSVGFTGEVTSDALLGAGAGVWDSDGVGKLSGCPHVLISAKRGEGIDVLKKTLAEMCAEFRAGTDAVLVTNMRHIEALTNAREALSRVKSGLADGIPSDLVSQDVREAVYHLGSIVGEISTDEVLGQIFGRFCIGK